jgi:hypothetical protein
MMQKAEAKSGNSKSNRELDRRTVTVRLGKGEIGCYDEIITELGLSLSLLVRTALKLFFMLFKHHKQGGRLKLVYADGSEEFLTILELQGAKQG